MIKYILPAIILVLIIIFWEKIEELIFKKLKIKLTLFLGLILSTSILLIIFLLID